MFIAVNLLQRLIPISQFYFLLLEANKRMEDNQNSKTIPLASVMSALGIDERELLNTENTENMEGV